MSFEDWMNPPPPGTTDDLPRERYDYHSVETKKDVKRSSESSDRSYDKYSYRSRSKSRERHHKRSRERYRSRSRDRRHRSRSGSRKRYHDRKSSSYKSRRSRYSRSRSRSHSRRHRKSYSRSPSYRKRSSRSRSNSTSSISDQDSSYQKRSSKPSEIDSSSKHFDEQDDLYEESTSTQENTFKNDGSFLEMFKKMQEQQQQATTSTITPSPLATVEKKTSIPIFGKRRGGRILKTGVVQKTKNQTEAETEPKDAWSVYMQEVRKYKEACCDDDSKTRPLVK